MQLCSALRRVRSHFRALLQTDVSRHTPFEGANNIDGGVTIDLRKLNQLEISSDRSTVEVGPANTWTDVYNVLDRQGLATIGGRAASVGVGGLVTGGGVSFFSPRFGYVADNVEDFEVVLAGGKVVHANVKTNPELWKALRGGSNNFGIVTSFTMRAFEQGNLWGGFLGLDFSTIQEQFAAFETLTGSEYDPFAALIFNLVWNSTANTWAASHNMVYTKPESDPPVFSDFLSLPQTFNTLRVANLSTLAGELDARNPRGRRQLFVTGTYKNSAAMMEEFYRISRTVVEPLQAIEDIKWSISFQPLPTIIQAVANANGGNSLGLSIADGNLFNVLLTATWDESADDALIETQAKSLFEEANARAKEMGVFNEYIYLNYAAKWQDPIAGYGAESKAKLQAVSSKYDPLKVFQERVPGGFKLFA
jgi:FAD/FMN-containing dehydrogenase